MGQGCLREHVGVAGRGSGLLSPSLWAVPGPPDQGRGRKPGRPTQVTRSALGRGSGRLRPLVGSALVGARLPPNPGPPFPSLPRWSLAGTGHARGPELHPRPWLRRQAGGGRGLQDHPASNRKTRPSPVAPRSDLSAEEEGGGLCPRGVGLPGGGGTFGRSPGGDERGPCGRSSYRPRRGAHLMDSAAAEVAPRPPPPPRGGSPPHEPPEVGGRSALLPGAGTEVLGE